MADFGQKCVKIGQIAKIAERPNVNFLTLFLFKTGRDTLWLSIKTKFRFITQFLTKLLSFPHSSSKTRNGIFAPGGLSLRPGKCRKVTPKKSVKESKNRHSCFRGNDPRHLLGRFKQIFFCSDEIKDFA